MWAYLKLYEKYVSSYNKPSYKCSMCHAIEGKGNKNMPLDGIGAKLSAADIKKWIVSPKEMKADTKMKAYPSLSAADLDALVAYLSSLKK